MRKVARWAGREECELKKICLVGWGKVEGEISLGRGHRRSASGVML